RTNPFAALKMAPVGLGLFLHKRLPLKPNRIKDMGELKAILNEAKALGGAK
ncbi:unnamed protein product, partial [marine sediment metagenome]